MSIQNIKGQIFAAGITGFLVAGLRRYRIPDRRRP